MNRRRIGVVVVVLLFGTVGWNLAQDTSGARKRCSTSLRMQWNTASVIKPGAATTTTYTLKSTRCPDHIDNQLIYQRWYDGNGFRIMEHSLRTNGQGMCPFQVTAPTLPPGSKVRVCGEFEGSGHLKPAKKCKGIKLR